MNNNTAFIKDNFNFDGMYLVYGSGQYTKDARFVARFKYSRRDKPSFMKFLIANFTVDEYFSALKNDAPATILEAKGWISPTVAKLRLLQNAN
jgi:hypothetical protein